VGTACFNLNDEFMVDARSAAACQPSANHAMQTESCALLALLLPHHDQQAPLLMPTQFSETLGGKGKRRYYRRPLLFFLEKKEKKNVWVRGLASNCSKIY
jgi:hypothetical protein